MMSPSLKCIPLGRIAKIALVFSFVLFAVIPQGAAKSPCHCRTATSERVEVGNTACIKTNDGLQEARCDFVLNNTAWKLTGKLCPIV